MAYEILLSLQHLDTVLLEDVRNIRLPEEGQELTRAQKGLRTRLNSLLVRQAKAIDPESLVRDESNNCIGITLDAFTLLTEAVRNPEIKRLPAVNGGSVRIEGMRAASLRILDAIVTERHAATAALDHLLGTPEQLVDL